MTPALRKAAPWSAGRPACRIHANPAFRKSGLPLVLLCTSALAGCATSNMPPPEIAYDNAMPAVQATEPRSRIEVTVTKQYRNMRYWLENDMRPVDLAAAAMRQAGIEPIFEVVRGGTDGSQLTERGLPTPNLFTGMQNVHGPLEWVTVQDMGQAVEVCIELAKLWAKKL